MASRPPLVSICTPTYRGARYLGQTIESVLRQSFTDFEYLILDDHSPDETAAVVARYADPRIRYIRHPANLGPEGNWNRCLELAQGKYFKLLPHDDLLGVDCLRQQVAILEADAGRAIALVFGARSVIDPQGRTLGTRRFAGDRPARIAGIELARRCVRAGTNLIGEPGNALFRRELVEQVGRYDATYPYLVDLDYWFRILLHGDAYYDPQPSSSFRLSDESWSVRIGRKQYDDFIGFVEKFRADTRYHLSSADFRLARVRARLNGVARLAIYRLLFATQRMRARA
jgi:glycosyltransferase involved in cell wall biosynthesis